MRHFLTIADPYILTVISDEARGVMSLVLPAGLAARMSSDRLSGFEKELAAEKVSSLGRAGRRLELALARWREPRPEDDAEDLLFNAAEAAHAYMIQRELCGFRDHKSAFAHYQVPAAVIARMGAARR
ncbi:hypothetical protein HJG53_00035 [Sphingomonas sp. ID1715]|uniref:DUF6665 family protein n=1 Tax=Sphingomonas sp. ID1715 TaxID=1656898 RepID=UPI0014896B02|nr:DUF6665 family protein [Sphingomonas sp. ID1715]NNM75301.1 hypothetical protein [Sphingomonas sp. ID1715]